MENFPSVYPPLRKALIEKSLQTEEVTAAWFKNDKLIQIESGEVEKLDVAKLLKGDHSRVASQLNELDVDLHNTEIRVTEGLVNLEKMR